MRRVQEEEERPLQEGPDGTALQRRDVRDGRCGCATVNDCYASRRDRQRWSDLPGRQVRLHSAGHQPLPEASSMASVGSAAPHLPWRADLHAGPEQVARFAASAATARWSASRSAFRKRAQGSAPVRAVAWGRLRL